LEVALVSRVAIVCLLALHAEVVWNLGLGLHGGLCEVLRLLLEGVEVLGLVYLIRRKYDRLSWVDRQRIERVGPGEVLLKRLLAVTFVRCEFTVGVGVVAEMVLLLVVVVVVVVV